MRIIAGQWRGRALAAVGKGDAAAHLRPTTDRTRESLFNVLSGGRFGDPITDARVLDLFAGTGALGLEALSRGAASAIFVDSGRKALSLMKRNIALCGAAQTEVLAADATRLPANPGEPFDLIFLDPPYGQDLGGPALRSAAAQGWLAADALVLWEESSEPAAPPGLDLLDRRRYGDTVVTFLRVSGPATTS